MSILSFLPFQAKHDELLQFAQDAISGIKRNADIARFSLSMREEVVVFVV
jgi:hypothetical protein